MNRTFLIIFFLFSNLDTVWGQKNNWPSPKKIEGQGISLLAMDTRDLLVCSDSEGNLFQLNSTGDTINHYSPATQAALQKLEISRMIQVFTFSEDLQRVEILDRFLQPLFSGRLDHPNIGWVTAACLGNNNVIWFFDASDLSLKQFNYQRNTLLQNQPLSLITPNTQWPILDLTEHQNMIFLQVKNQGIYLFDNQANYLDFIPLKTNQKVSFSEDHLFFISNGQLIKFNFHTRKTTKFTLPQEGFHGVRLGTHKMVFFSENEIQVYPYPFTQK